LVREVHTGEAATTGSAASGGTTFSSAGAIPSVAGGAETASAASASDRAFGAHATAAQPTVQWHGGEPLPVLKDLFFAPLTSGNLHTFKKMIDGAPLRPGTHIRTPLSPADGLATIITDFVLRVANLYMPFTQQHHEPHLHAWLQTVIHNHLTLLSTPNHGTMHGGHLTRGFDGKFDALIGSTTPQDVAVNQAAITVLTLQDMHENPDPHYQHQYGKKVRHLIALLTPELMHEVVTLYPAGQPPHRWRYNTAGKLEDQGHLKTTWSQLQRLGQSQSSHAAWYKHQADRIAHESPHVLAPWEDQSGVAGGCRP